MPRKEEKEDLPTSTRQRVLAELIDLGEATSYELEKKIGIGNAAIAKHLKALAKAGLAEGPIEDTSSGRLRKKFKASDGAEDRLAEALLKDTPEEVRDQLLSKLRKVKGELK